MGDIIEKTLRCYDPFEFYKPGGKSIWVDIKARRMVIIGLITSPESPICNWVEISNPGTVSVNVSNGRSIQSGLPFTLSNENYTRIWIAWDSKYLWAGIGQSLNIVASSKLKVPINYFTVSTKDSVNPCTFRFEVPPASLKIPSAITPKISAGKLEWKTCDEQLPDDAVIGGYINGEVIYIIRAHHRGSLTPGAFIPSQGLAFIAWGGSDNPTSNFDALCGFNFEWKSGREARIPADAFKAGYSEDHHELLFIGRAQHQGNVIPGKVQLSHEVCYIPYEGKEIAVKEYEVLTEPGANPYSENKFIRPALAGVRFPYNEEQEDGDFEDDDYQDHEQAYIF